MESPNGRTGNESVLESRIRKIEGDIQALTDRLDQRDHHFKMAAWELTGRDREHIFVNKNEKGGSG
jgi:hypothetical protein